MEIEVNCEQHGTIEPLLSCPKCSELSNKNFNHLQDQFNYIYDLKYNIKQILSTTTDNHSEALNEIKKILEEK